MIKKYLEILEKRWGYNEERVGKELGIPVGIVRWWRKEEERGKAVRRGEERLRVLVEELGKEIEVRGRLLMKGIWGGEDVRVRGRLLKRKEKGK